MGNKKILVVSQYFYPEQFRINDICKTWVEQGYNVTVLTGIPNYPEGNFYEEYGINKKRKELYKGIEIIRVPIIPRRKSSIMLGLNYLSFVFSAYMWKIFNQKKFDLVFVYEVSPMTQAIPAVKIAKKLKIPCYIYVMDLWPENFEIITGINNSFVIGNLNKMVDYIYNNCEKIFTASKSFKRNIEERGIDKNKIYYWPQYAEDFYQPSNVKNTKILRDERINITFAGNLGEGQGLEILPKLGNKLKKENLSIRFNLVGNGRYKKELQSDIKKQGLEEYFCFIDPVPAEEVPSIFCSSDFSFICLKDDPIFSMTIPAKLQSSMACSMPILLSANGEVQSIIKDSNSGLFNSSGDVEGLYENIKRISKMTSKEIKEMSRNSLKYYNEHFKKDKLMRNMNCYILKEIEDV